jgi:hypothetical protein
MKERLYLDNCSFNRPYDEQSILKNHFESEAKIYIQKEILNKSIDGIIIINPIDFVRIEGCEK